MTSFGRESEGSLDVILVKRSREQTAMQVNICNLVVLKVEKLLVVRKYFIVLRKWANLNYLIKSFPFLFAFGAW